MQTRGPTIVVIFLAIFGITVMLNAATDPVTTEIAPLICQAAYEGNSITAEVNLAAPPAIILSSANCATFLQRADEALMIATNRNATDVYGMVKNDTGVTTNARIRHPGTAIQTSIAPVNAANTVNVSKTAYILWITDDATAAGNSMAAFKGRAIDARLNTYQALAATTTAAITLGQCAVSSASANSASAMNPSALKIDRMVENGGSAKILARCSTSNSSISDLNLVADLSRKWISLSAGGIAMVVPQVSMAAPGKLVGQVAKPPPNMAANTLSVNATGRLSTIIIRV